MIFAAQLASNSEQQTETTWSASRLSQSRVSYRYGPDIFPFLELPREIRGQIYDDYIADDRTSSDTKIYGLIALRHVQQSSLHRTFLQVHGDQNFIQTNRQIAFEFVETLHRLRANIVHHLFLIASPSHSERPRLQRAVVTDLFSRLKNVRRLVVSIGLSQTFREKYSGLSCYPSWPGHFEDGSATVLVHQLTACTNLEDVVIEWASALPGNCITYSSHREKQSLKLLHLLEDAVAPLPKIRRSASFVHHYAAASTPKIDYSYSKKSYSFEERLARHELEQQAEHAQVFAKFLQDMGVLSMPFPKHQDLGFILLS
ncbi:hypothetical protein LTR78_004363 [Recurvomyces mirabilis]|uniref:Uncharacterized protein n=1 Tax=Recurvomyces mirabilis TaxID=574656 RepID=A0AAE0WPR3_9PEZI|nr:hypothetical protein LTR78_004363 [Recurvomyces mirabilis]KAK5155971.1 hypothetical protein LTS14_005537 [Recurvomyces mirabilis]